MQLLLVNELNAYDVLCNDWIVFTEANLPASNTDVAAKGSAPAAAEVTDTDDDESVEDEATDTDDDESVEDEAAGADDKESAEDEATDTDAKSDDESEEEKS